MGFIYENSKEYSETCKCDIETANKRCSYYLHLHELMEKVNCPNCNAEYHKLTFDDDGGDYPSEPFISCTECWETFGTDDKRLKDWVNYQIQFDEVLAISLSEIDEYGIGNWVEFVKKSTEELSA